MATAFKHRKQVELEEARKAGLAAAELDEDGKEINPHIPQYVCRAPWYLYTDERPSLKHQRKRKSDPNHSKSWWWYDRGAKTFQAQKFRKGACDNCGALTHHNKACVERPRKSGAKWTGKHIAPDEKIEAFELLDYDGKRDPWNGYDTQHQARSNQNKQEEGLKVKVDDESKQFAKVEKRVRTTGGGSTGTVRDLRIREDTAKYLVNLDVNSAYYDPKSRSMREDPLPDVDPNHKVYAGDNQNRVSGQALEFKHLNTHAWQAAPSQAELLYKNFKINKVDNVESRTKHKIMDKYGDSRSADDDQLLLLWQSEREVEYDWAGRVIKGQEMASKY